PLLDAPGFDVGGHQLDPGVARHEGDHVSLRVDEPGDVMERTADPLARDHLPVPEDVRLPRTDGNDIWRVHAVDVGDVRQGDPHDLDDHVPGTHLRAIREQMRNVAVEP